MRLLFIFLAFISVNCFTQSINQSFTADSTHGVETKYATCASPILLYRGIGTFQFTSSHDTATVYFEGNNKGTIWFPVDTIDITGSAAVNRRFTVVNPEYVYYRLKKVGSSGDTCYFTNQRFIYKF